MSGEPDRLTGDEYIEQLMEESAKGTSLKQVILELDRLYEAGDTLQLRSLLANLRREIR